MKPLIERLIKQYDDLIVELEQIDNENKAFVPTANQISEDPMVIEWSRFARDNRRRLQMAKAEKALLQDINLKLQNENL